MSEARCYRCDRSYSRAQIYREHLAIAHYKEAILARFKLSAGANACPVSDCKGYIGSALARHLGATHGVVDDLMTPEETTEYNRLRATPTSTATTRPPGSRPLGRPKGKKQQPFYELENPERVKKLLADFREFLVSQKTSPKIKVEIEDAFECVLCGEGASRILQDGADLKLEAGNESAAFRAHLLLRHARIQLESLAKFDDACDLCQYLKTTLASEEDEKDAFPRLEHFADGHNLFEKIYPDNCHFDLIKGNLVDH